MSWRCRRCRSTTPASCIYQRKHGKRSGSCRKDPTVADQAAEAVVVVALIVVGVVVAEMVGTIVTLAVHLCLDRARWDVTSATSAAKRGTGRMIADPS
jgi:hypothetical protein